ncbi:DUF4190 domain-containing protein [Kitasatospora sp. NPDC028055]|uniref:DUF4190 domain-containing protein n=1 Tax=Kitasatospora sp. NPDC028055 TaxID=3155653 RepID=UPI0033EF5F34
MSTVTDHAVTSRAITSRAATGRSSSERTTERTAGRAADERQGTAEADNLAVASFLLGLPGLLLFNLVLGPIAVTLATLALVRGTSRRGRAFLGLALGIASLAILAVTTATSHGVLIDLGS